MITSTRNPKLQQVRRLLMQSKARRKANAFVLEGVRLIEEAFQSAWPVQLILWSDDLSSRGRHLLAQSDAIGITCEQVDAAILQSISDTQTSQGILAVLDMKPLPLPIKPDFILVLDNLRDPGNLGTILRTASAAGVQAVLLSTGSSDPYNPKSVRSAMGAHFRLPVHMLDWSEISAYLFSLSVSGGKTGDLGKPVDTFLADVAGDLPYIQADFRTPLALIIGAEAEGAGSDARQIASRCLSIPMPGHAESLNAAIAAAVLMFEVVRQRSG